VGAAVGVGDAGEAVTVAWLGTGEAEAGAGWDAVVPDEHATSDDATNALHARTMDRQDRRRITTYPCVGRSRGGSYRPGVGGTL